MCTPIYYVHNITLWTCPTKLECPNIRETTNTINYTLSNPFNSTNHTYVNSTNHTFVMPFNSTNHTFVNSTNHTLVNSTNHTFVNKYNSSLLHSICAELYLSQTPSPSDVQTVPDIYVPSPTNYLRRDYRSNHSAGTNMSNSTNTSGLHKYKDEIPVDLSWLHVFWLLPIICCLIYVVKYRNKMRLRIVSMFVPKERYIKRSRSWPELGHAHSSIDQRSKSEPAFDTVVF